jgi:hypothetical protein
MISNSCPDISWQRFCDQSATVPEKKRRVVLDDIPLGYDSIIYF